MAAYRLNLVASLASQLKFTPVGKRAEQLDRVEALLLTLRPDAALTAAEVVEGVTGFHGHAGATGERLVGAALLHDFGLLLEEVSATLPISAADAGAVLDVGTLAERFNVTTKTIQRWRRKGLPARRFAGADGRVRVGVRLASALAFVRRVEPGAVAGIAVALAGDDDAIVRFVKARDDGRCDRTTLVRRAARRFGRPALAVVGVLKHARVSLPAAGVDDGVRLAADVAERGVSLAEAASGVEASPRRVYGELVRRAAERHRRRKARFVHDDLFDDKTALRALRGTARGHEGNAPALPSARGGLGELLAIAPMSPAQERATFVLFNHSQRRYARARRRAELATAGARVLRRLDRLAARADGWKNKLVRANLRLVASVAKRHVRSSGGATLPELVSEGTVVLMRSVETFDAGRGTRFASYATLALMKGFAQQRRAPASAGVDVELVVDRASAAGLAGLARREEVARLLGALDARERAAVAERFGLRGEADAGFARLSKRRRLLLGRRAVEKLRKLAVETVSDVG